MKEKLTIDKLKAEAKAFCIAESKIQNKSLFGVTDGKAVGTHIEHKFQEQLNSKYKTTIGSSANGIDLPSDDILTDIKVTSIKQGSSRFSTYNWETNFSNAGSDWFNTNDNALVSRYTLKEQKAPGLAVDSLINTAVQYKIPYAVTTIPMCGYAAADANGPVLSEQNAPSSRWIPFIFKKSEPFSLTPDLTDNAVYADESKWKYALYRFMEWSGLSTF